MNYLIAGNSHLSGFEQALRHLDPVKLQEAIFLPTSNTTNLAKIIHGETETAQLTFGDLTVEKQLPPREQSTLIIVGNGNYGHYSTFNRNRCGLPPLWIHNSIAGTRNQLPYDSRSAYPPASTALFRAVYDKIPVFNLLERWGFTISFFNQFCKVHVFASPTPARSFFEKLRPIENYLECMCLQSFKYHYTALFRQKIDELGLHNLEIHTPSPALEHEEGTTLCDYLLDEPVQVHANEKYWIQSITESGIFRHRSKTQDLV